MKTYKCPFAADASVEAPMVPLNCKAGDNVGVVERPQFTDLEVAVEYMGDTGLIQLINGRLTTLARNWMAGQLRGKWTKVMEDTAYAYAHTHLAEALQAVQQSAFKNGKLSELTAYLKEVHNEHIAPAE